MENAYEIFKVYKCKILENKCPRVIIKKLSRAKKPICIECEVYINHNKKMEEDVW